MRFFCFSLLISLDLVSSMPTFEDLLPHALHATDMPKFIEYQKCFREKDQHDILKSFFLKEEFSTSLECIRCKEKKDDAENIQLIDENLDRIMNVIPDVDRNGQTILYSACKNGYGVIVDRLLNKKHSVNERTKLGFLPIDAAARQGNTAIVEKLLAYQNENHADEYGATALHWAALYGKKEVVSRLIKFGYDVNACAYKDLQTPLWMAVKGGKSYSNEAFSSEDHEEVVTLLLGAGAYINYLNPLSQTPLFMALRCSSITIACILLKHGADLNLLDQNTFLKYNKPLFNKMRENPYCFFCKKNKPDYECSRCSYVCYCSIKCQQDDWFFHQSLCERFSS